MKTRQKIGYAIFFGMISLGLLACGGVVPPQETTAVSLSIQTAPHRSKLRRFSASVPSSISSVTIAVSGDNMDSKSETLPVIAGETLQWTDQIQNGLNRLFTVTGKGVAEEEICSGSKAIDLLGQAVTLNIALKGCPFTLRLSLQGNGEGTVTSDPQGIACGSDCEASYLFNTRVALVATAAAGSRFSGFNGDDPRCASATIIMTTDLKCIAIFDLSTPSQLLKITLEGRGLGTIVSSPAGIDCGFDCTAPFDQGSTVVLSATANAGSRFVGFSGDLGCTALSPLSLVMSVNLNCTATFEAIPPSPELSILLQGTGLGRVTSSPVGIDCGITCIEIFAQGRRVTLTATPEVGSRFVTFSGSSCTGVSPLFLRIDGDLTCIASFKAIAPSPTLTILLQGTGGGTVTSSPGGINCGADCTEIIAQGRRVALTATPSAGSIFARLTGPPGCADTSFVMEGDRTCTVIFERAIIAP